MTTSTPPRYRPEIDGLRALAVLPVVLFHADIAGFSGGFVGVDVFFVISGYLITRLIQDDIVRGKFSIQDFYERRARRIFPALFVMLGACAFFGAWLLYPQDYQRFAESLIAATFFVSSILFSTQTGYFAGAAEDKPLLHTWSLSVEELFYLAFPAVLILASRILGQRWLWLLITLAVTSFGASVAALLIDSYSPSAFYLLHYRAWELLLGSILAVAESRVKLQSNLEGWCANTGIALILVAMLTYSSATPFPGIAALLPCLGAAAVIHCGSRSRSGALRLLRWKPFVFIRLISYSLYLWHWPLFVFFTDWAGRRATTTEALGLVLTSFLVALVSWQFVEKPFRGSRSKVSKKTLFAGTAAIMSALFTVGLHGVVSEGWIGRYDKAFVALYSARDDRDPRQQECLSPAENANGCDYGKPGAMPTAVLWGDSHAAVYAVALGNLVAQRGDAIRVFTMWSCPPTTGWQITGQRWQTECANLQDRAAETIFTVPSIRSVFLAARFGQLPSITDREAALHAFASTVDSLLAAGKRVIIVYPVPEIPQGKGGAARLSVVSTPEGPALASQETDEFLNANRQAFHWLDELGEHDNLFRIYPHKALCDDEYCYAARNGVGFYFDEHHLSLAGARLVIPAFTAALYGNVE